MTTARISVNSPFIRHPDHWPYRWMSFLTFRPCSERDESDLERCLREHVDRMHYEIIGELCFTYTPLTVRVACNVRPKLF